MTRHSTGIPQLDEKLGGGLIPGSLTVVVGATGIGKTQLGIHYAHAGQHQERHRGVIFDMCARGDSQSHQQYSQRLFDWSLRVADSQASPPLSNFYAPNRELDDYLHVFDYRGRRVTRRDLDWDDWRQWQSELNHKLAGAIGFLYGSFVRGRQRVVVDGIEPAERPHESIQLNLFEYIYHQILRKDAEWVARDLFREQFRRNADAHAAHRYDNSHISCLLLHTSRETLLSDLIARPLDEGDALSNANTLIYMGRIAPQESGSGRVGRGMHIAKHRGSACSDEIIPFRVTARGIELE